jgi:hypothetical protein
VIRRLQKFNELFQRLKDNTSFLSKDFAIYVSLSSLCLADQLDLIHHWLLQPETLHNASLICSADKICSAGTEQHNHFYRIVCHERIYIGLAVVQTVQIKPKSLVAALQQWKPERQASDAADYQAYNQLVEANLTLLYYLFLEANQQSKIKQFCPTLYQQVNQEILSLIPSDKWRQIRLNCLNTFKSTDDINEMIGLL